MTTANQQSTSIDLAYLKMVSNGDESFERNMIEGIVVEIEQKMGELKRSVSANHSEGIRLQAHSLKNLYAMLGAGSLRETCFGLEANHASMSSELLHHHYLACEKEWGAVQKELRAVLAAYGAKA